MHSTTDILLEVEQKRLHDARAEADRIDPTTGFAETVLGNMGSVNLIFANFLLQSIVESQPGNRQTVTMLILLVQVLVIWGFVNWAIKQWVVRMAVSSRLFARSIVMFLADITGILTFLTIQYALSIFTRQNQEGTLSLVEFIVVALVMKLVLSVITAVVGAQGQLSQKYKK